ncbi:MAG: hypothetical protein ACXV5Q_13615 [Frankiaceae bacterium]
MPTTRPTRNPSTRTPVDQHYDTLGADMHVLFNHLGISAGRAGA